jgi:hypothetical protein
MPSQVKTTLGYLKTPWANGSKRLLLCQLFTVWGIRLERAAKLWSPRARKVPFRVALEMRYAPLVYKFIHYR